jgi:hypothetical protein
MKGGHFTGLLRYKAMPKTAAASSRFDYFVHIFQVLTLDVRNTADAPLCPAHAIVNLGGLWLYYGAISAAPGP